MKRNNWKLLVLSTSLLAMLQGCQLLKMPKHSSNLDVPKQYATSSDSGNSAKLSWRTYFTDPNLIALIDTALHHNRELNMMKQEIEIAQYEVKARKGEYLPFVGYGSSMGVDHSGKYTFNGMSEEDLKTNKENPRYIGDFNVGANFSWELDIWKKLRNARKAAIERYFATIEGRNFTITNMIAEIANSYYELLSLDNQLRIVEQNIDIQKNALNMIKQQKEAAKVSQLAVNRFEALLLNTTNLQYDIKQKMVGAENNINFLTGRFPAPILRTTANYYSVFPESIQAGIPSQLLQNRPDIRQAERALAAANLDIEVAKANFYPNIRLSANLGLQAFNPAVWFKPQSLLFGMFGDLVGPLINQNALRANFMTSHAKQVQAIYSYEQTILRAMNEVQNQLSAIDNYSKSVDVKSKEVDILTQSIGISDNLYKYARADYIEVLLTQREALDSKMELAEIRLNQLKAKVNVYRALGGGWN